MCLGPPCDGPPTAQFTVVVDGRWLTSDAPCCRPVSRRPVLCFPVSRFCPPTQARQALKPPSCHPWFPPPKVPRPVRVPCQKHARIHLAISGWDLPFPCTLNLEPIDEKGPFVRMTILDYNLISSRYTTTSYESVLESSSTRARAKSTCRLDREPTTRPPSS